MKFENETSYPVIHSNCQGLKRLLQKVL